MAGTYELPAVGEANSSADPKTLAALKGYNESLNASNKLEGSGIANEAIKNAQLSKEARPFVWYTPKIIATEETRESTSFGTLTTADEIKEVVLPANGLMLIGFDGSVKSSVAAAGRAAIFIGANQLKIEISGKETAVQEVTPNNEIFTHIASSSQGLAKGQTNTWGGSVTTGQILSVGTAGANSGGPIYVFAAAGTYNISVQYKATSGNVTAKERKLWVGVIGV